MLLLGVGWAKGRGINYLFSLLEGGWGGENNKYWDAGNVSSQKKGLLLALKLGRFLLDTARTILAAQFDTLASTGERRRRRVREQRRLPPPPSLQPPPHHTPPKMCSKHFCLHRYHSSFSFFFFFFLSDGRRKELLL